MPTDAINKEIHDFVPDLIHLFWRETSKIEIQHPLLSAVYGNHHQHLGIVLPLVGQNIMCFRFHIRFPICFSKGDREGAQRIKSFAFYPRQPDQGNGTVFISTLGKDIFGEADR